MSPPPGVSRANPWVSFHAPKRLVLGICPNVSANPWEKQVRLIAPNSRSGTTSSMDVTVVGERHGTASGKDHTHSLWAALPAAGVFVTSKAGIERFLRSSALLFIFSNAHKLSTNNQLSSRWGGLGNYVCGSKWGLSILIRESWGHREFLMLLPELLSAAQKIIVTEKLIRAW